MHKRNFDNLGNMAIAAVLAVFIIFAGVGGYYFLRSKELIKTTPQEKSTSPLTLTPEVSPIKDTVFQSSTPSMSPQKPVLGWKTLRNIKYNYEIKYPTSWDLNISTGTWFSETESDANIIKLRDTKTGTSSAVLVIDIDEIENKEEISRVTLAELRESLENQIKEIRNVQNSSLKISDTSSAGRLGIKAEFRGSTDILSLPFGTVADNGLGMFIDKEHSLMIGIQYASKTNETEKKMTLETVVNSFKFIK